MILVVAIIRIYTCLDCRRVFVENVMIAVLSRSLINYGRAYFSVYYYTKCVLLKAGCATLKRKVYVQH